MTNAGPQKILIIDDDARIRDGLAKLLTRGSEFTVAGEAANAFDGLMMAQDREVDLALVDLYLPGFHGFTLIEKLRAAHPNLKIVVYTAHDDEYFALSALRAGADGFISKSEPAENTIAALRSVASGQLYLEPEIRKRLLSLVENTPEIEVQGLLNNGRNVTG
jgi:DNA-binding NarL/FixJ family response regulator